MILGNHVLSAAKRRSAILLVLAALLLVWGCTGPSSEDREKLRELERRFGDRYTFKFETEFNLGAQLKKGAASSERDAEKIYKIFIFRDFEKGERRKTSYVYLNVYDENGAFLYQFFYDPQSKTFEKGKVPYY